jgi:hypothetical protein
MEAAAPEAPAFSVVADVAIVKGETPSGDRTWLSFPEGTARREAVDVITDPPHLVAEVESVFGLDDGRWSTLAAPQFCRLRLVTDDVAFSNPMSPKCRLRHVREKVVGVAACPGAVARTVSGPCLPGVRTALTGFACGIAGPTASSPRRR